MEKSLICISILHQTMTFGDITMVSSEAHVFSVLMRNRKNKPDSIIIILFANPSHLICKPSLMVRDKKQTVKQRGGGATRREHSLSDLEETELLRGRLTATERVLLQLEKMMWTYEQPMATHKFKTHRLLCPLTLSLLHRENRAELSPSPCIKPSTLQLCESAHH